MELRGKFYWNEALKGGTVIGLVAVAFNFLKSSLVRVDEISFWPGFVSFVGFAVFVALVYSFTRKMSRLATPEEGFNYGRCVSYVIAMMLFAGFIVGLYNFIVMRFTSPEIITESLNTALAAYQGMFPEDQLDNMYAMAKKMLLSPLYNIFAGIFGYVFQGIFVGIFTSAFTKRNPSIFPDNRPEESGE